MNIQTDSRKVQQGDVFFALPGATVDGRNYIKQALELGASKIVYEQNGIEKFDLPEASVPLVAIENLSKQQGYLAAEFYGYPSKQLNIIGITGTNGKTSISYFIAQCLEHTALLGTTGFGRLDNLQQSGFTTPMAPDVCHILKQFVDANIEHVAMEVSSHALTQHRVEGIAFDIAVFSNLSHDHLDFHGDIQAYAAAKKRLFMFAGLKHAVINIDDAVGVEIANECSANVLSYSTEKHADIYASDIEAHHDGSSFKLHTPWGKGDCKLPLLGRFNVSNSLAVVGVLGLQGMAFDLIVDKLSQLTTPPGRMQLYCAPGQPLVAVDFAHTPDALQQALEALREHCNGLIYTVFGCGGNRDAEKRYIMGEVASNLSDFVLITNDNPRHESPMDIAQAIRQGVSNDKLLGIELDRSAAIDQAIAEASESDLVLIAGKGHEAIQVVGDEVLPFSDGEVVKRLLKLEP